MNDFIKEFYIFPSMNYDSISVILTKNAYNSLVHNKTLLRYSLNTSTTKREDPTLPKRRTPIAK
jgi:hypothetical protein